MSTAHPRTRPRVIVDPGVYVSAALTEGAPRDLIRAARAGQLTLVVSEKLLDELSGVLAREKFRRWLSPEDAEAFVDAIALLAEHVTDPSMEGRRAVCRDPKDEYLIALAEHTAATYLISGDSDLLTIRHGGVVVRNPRGLLDELAFDHPWGQGVLPGRAEEALAQAEAEGHDQLLAVALAFLVLMEQPDATGLLPALVTPESLGSWERDLVDCRRMLADRGVASRAEYPSPGVAYVKLPPDPGMTVRSSSAIALPGALILTLQRRPELPDVIGAGGWRVHALGDYVRPEDLPRSIGD